MTISSAKREKILNLYAVGMSTVNISRVTNVSRTTVHNTVNKSNDVQIAQPWTSESMHQWKTFGNGKKRSL
jgi:orotate phosphoribosyltransferase-like protein